MLITRSIEDLLPNLPEGTILLPNPVYLSPRERGVLEQVDNTIATWWAIWEKERTSFCWSRHGRFVFFDPIGDDDQYNGDKLADVFVGLRELVTAGHVPVLTIKSLIMLGLPGNGHQEQDKALDDLRRWYETSTDEVVLTIYRET